jgi:hypothetical protein
MKTSESFRALRRANPRSKDGFAESVEAVAEAVRVRIADSVEVTELRAAGAPERRRFVRIAAAAALVAVAAAATALLTLDSPGGGTVEDATAAVERAATVSAASAERSGTAVVRITQEGELWAGRTIRWHGADLVLSSDAPRRRGKAGVEFLVVDGMMYGIDPGDGAWAELGPPESIDPDSGTTPAEYLAAVREDVGGATLRRFAGSVGALTTQPLADGSTVYSGKVAAGLIARESGFKEGQAIRVFPFGYVAHGAAANPAALLDVAVTVGANGFVRELAVRWPGWVYSVTYSKLGATPAPAAPANARPLLARRKVR